MTINLLFGECV